MGTPDKKTRTSGSKKQAFFCQVDGCSTKLSNCKPYCVRYRVCQQHLSAVSVLLKGVESRFCQQCGRFHDLSEFDGTKRSCRTRLAHHNNIRQQRRKEAATAHLLANSVLDLPRSSRPSAARTPGTFGYLINSPDHSPEYSEYTGPSSSRDAAAYEAGRHHAAAPKPAGGSTAKGSSQHAAAVRHQSHQGTHQGNSRWTEATAAEFFTRKPPTKRIWYEPQPQHTQQAYGGQQHQQHQQQQRHHNHQQQQPQQHQHVPALSRAWQPAASQTATPGALQLAEHTPSQLMFQQQHQQPHPLALGHLSVDAADSPMPSLQQTSGSPVQHRLTQHITGGLLPAHVQDTGKGISTPHSSMNASATTGFAPSNSSSPSTASNGIHPQQHGLSEAQLAGSKDLQQGMGSVGHPSMLPPNAYHAGHRSSSDACCLHHARGGTHEDRPITGLLEADDALTDAVMGAAADASASSNSSRTGMQRPNAQAQQQLHLTRADYEEGQGPFSAYPGTARSTFTAAEHGRPAAPQSAQQEYGVMSPSRQFETPSAIAAAAGTSRPLLSLCSVPEDMAVAHVKEEPFEGRNWQGLQQQGAEQQLSSFSGSAAGTPAEQRSNSYTTAYDSSSFTRPRPKHQEHALPSGCQMVSPGRYHPQPHMHAPTPQGWTVSLQQAGSSRLGLDTGLQPCGRVVSSSCASRHPHAMEHMHSGHAMCGDGCEPSLAVQEGRWHPDQRMQSTVMDDDNVLSAAHQHQQQQQAEPMLVTPRDTTAFVKPDGHHGAELHLQQQGYASTSSRFVVPDSSRMCCPTASGTPALHRVGSGSSREDWGAPSPFARRSTDFSAQGHDMRQQQPLQDHPQLQGPHATSGSLGPDTAAGAGLCSVLSSPHHVAPAAAAAWTSSSTRPPSVPSPQQALTRHLSLPTQRATTRQAASYPVLNSPPGFAAGLAGGREGSGALEPGLITSWSTCSLEGSMPLAPADQVGLRPPGGSGRVSGDFMHSDSPRVVLQRTPAGVMSPGAVTAAAWASGGPTGLGPAVEPVQLQRWRSEPATTWGAQPLATQGSWQEQAQHRAIPGAAVAAGATNECARGGLQEPQRRSSQSQGGGAEGRRSSGSVPPWYLSRLAESADAVINHQQLPQGPARTPFAAAGQPHSAAAVMGPPAAAAHGSRQLRGLQGFDGAMAGDGTAAADTRVAHGMQSPQYSAGAHVSPRGPTLRPQWSDTPCDGPACNHATLLHAAGGSLAVARHFAPPSAAPVWPEGQLEHSGSSGPGTSYSGDMLQPGPELEVSRMAHGAPSAILTGQHPSRWPQQDTNTAAPVQQAAAQTTPQLAGHSAVPAALPPAAPAAECAEQQHTDDVDATPRRCAADEVQASHGVDDSWDGLEECLLADTTDATVADLMQWAADGADVLDLITDGDM